MGVRSILGPFGGGGGGNIPTVDSLSGNGYDKVRPGIKTEETALPPKGSMAGFWGVSPEPNGDSQEIRQISQKMHI